MGRIGLLLLLLGMGFSSGYPARSGGEEASPPQAQRRSGAEEQVKLQTELILLDVLVLSEKTGQVVTGLRKEDFELYEDGVKQQITHFERATPPLSIVFLLDLESGFYPFIAHIRQGLPQILERLREEDEVALLVVAWNKIWLVQEFTKNKQLLAEKFVSAEPSLPPTWTNVIAGRHRVIYEAAVYQNTASSRTRRRVIIAFMDDYPWYTRMGGGEKHAPTFKPSKRQTRSKWEILKHLVASGSIVSALVAPHPMTPKARSANKFLEEHPITKIRSWIIGYNPWEHAGIEFYVERTGGEARIVNGENAAAQLGELIDRLYLRYSLGYVPSNPKRDGKFRKIEVKVSPEVEQREGGILIKTREGYFAPRGESLKEAAGERPPVDRKN